MFRKLFNRSGRVVSKNNRGGKLKRFHLAVDGLDERVLLTGVAATYAVTNDWGSGYQAQISLKNTDATAVNNWKLEFDLPASISSIWNAQVTQHTGTHYVVTGLSWDINLDGNGKIDVGYVAAPGGSAPAPTNMTLNGVVLNSSGGTTVTTPSISSANVTANVGSTAATTAVFTMSLSKAATTPVTVQYATADGTAKAGVDYIATSGTLTFPAGSTTQTINVSIPAAAAWKADSSFSLKLSAPGGATLATSTATGTIHNLNTPPASANGITYKVTNDWGSGFNGQIDIKNSGTTAVNNWVLTFNFPGQISSLWNGVISSHVGNTYTVTPASWNASIGAGSSISIGFTGSPGGGAATPTNFVLTPPISGGGGGGTGTISPPVAVNDTTMTYAGTSSAINVLANDTDPNGLAMTVKSVTQPTSGSVTINADNTVTYMPKIGFTGADSFTYTITDAKGGTATATVAMTVVALPAPPTWTAREFSPYVDMTLYPMYDLVTAAKTTGVKNFSLAFITADSSGKPAWGGYSSYGVDGSAFDTAVRQQITSLRAMGGDVMVSFGGAAGQELAQVVTNVTTLKNAYATVINAYNLTHIDFDIEGAAGADKVSIDRRSQAIAAVQKDMAAAGKPLEVWFTLPVLPTGLTADGLYSLQSALKYGVQIGGVNVMAMDYGDYAAPNPSGQMGTYAIQSGTSLFNQLRTLYGSTPTDAQLWSMVGVTPMIGVNDVTSEVFDLSAAQQLTSWAKQKGVGRLAMWSMNRDQPPPGGSALTYANATNSSILQKPYDFAKTFVTYVG